MIFVIKILTVLEKTSVTFYKSIIIAIINGVLIE